MKNAGSKKIIVYLTRAAVIAALYCGLTLALAPISFGAIQFRVSEALTVLPLMLPEAIPGLTVGCLLSNAIGLGMGLTVAPDLLFGTFATLAAAVLTRACRKIRFKGLPLLSLFFPVISNALFVGMELSLFLDTNAGFFLSFLSVGAGELIVCYVLGLPLTLLLERNKLFKKVSKQ